MKHVLSFTLLLIASSASAQELTDSASWGTELEDSISQASVKFITDSEELLLHVLERLQRDAVQKHHRREYELEATYAMSKGPLTVRRTFAVEGDDGIDITDVNHSCENGPISFNGPYRITRQDSTDIESDLFTEAYRGMVHLDGLRYRTYCITHLFQHYKINKILKAFLKTYEVSAYSLAKEEGDVICIQLKERERDSHPQTYMNVHLYVCPRSLRLLRMEGTEYRLHGFRYQYRQEFGEEDKAPILTKSIGIMTLSGRNKARYVIQLK